MRSQSRYHRGNEVDSRRDNAHNLQNARYPVAPPVANVWHTGGTPIQCPPSSRKETPSRFQQHTPRNEWIGGKRIYGDGLEARHKNQSSRTDDLDSPSPIRRVGAHPVKSREKDATRVQRAAGSTSSWWVPNLVAKNLFEATAPRHLSCALCGDPALPFTVITPCGHVVCKTCGDDSTRCPECECGILARTAVPQMSGCVMASLSFECKTRRCTFTTLDPHDAFNHTCGNYSNIHGDRRSTSSVAADATLTKGEDLVPSNDAAARSSSSNPLDRVAALSAPPSSISHLLRTKQRKTMLFWDLDSMQPSFYGLAPHLFFRKLLGCLVTSCGVASEVQSLVYCPDDIDSAVASSLAELGAFTRIYPAEGLSGKEAMTTAAVACVCVDIRQLIESVLSDSTHGGFPASESETMYDIVLVSAAPRFLVGSRKLLCEVSRTQQRSPFFMHVVSDMAALPVSQKIEIQRGAVTYVDAADFTRE